jgi:hypothetical protein
MYIRFETAYGLGLFAEAAHFPRCERYQREAGISRRDGAEFERCYNDLCYWTPAAPWWAYEDSMSRRPRTWFKASRTEVVRAAWGLMEVLNRNGSMLRPRWSVWPGTVLFEDEVQVVVRPRCVYPLKKRREKGVGWTGDRETIRRREWRSN